MLDDVPHDLERRRGTGPEDDLTGGLVYQHAQAASDCRAVALGLQEKRCPYRIVNEVNNKLTCSEPGRIHAGDKSSFARGDVVRPSGGRVGARTDTNRLGRAGRILRPSLTASRPWSRLSRRLDRSAKTEDAQDPALCYELRTCRC